MADPRVMVGILADWSRLYGPCGRKKKEQNDPAIFSLLNAVECRLALQSSSSALAENEAFGGEERELLERY